MLDDDNSPPEIVRLSGWMKVVAIIVALAMVLSVAWWIVPLLT